MKSEKIKQWHNNTFKDDILSNLEVNDKMVVFDTETTGLGGRVETKVKDEETGKSYRKVEYIDEDSVKIIQFSAILYGISKNEDGNYVFNELDSLNLYINPMEKLNEKVIEVTGITDEMLSKADTEDIVAERIMRFMEKADLWVGYNIPYDLKRLSGMAKRQNMSFCLDSNPQAKGIIDVMEIARNDIAYDDIVSYKKTNKISKGLWRLQTVTPMELPEFDAKFHDSMEDVRSTTAVMEKLLPRMKELQTLNGDETIVVRSCHPSQYATNPSTRRVGVYAYEAKEGLVKDTGIYWDMTKKQWGVKSNSKYKTRFENGKLDMLDIERQALQVIQNKGYKSRTNEFLPVNMENLSYDVFNNWADSPSYEQHMARLRERENQFKQAKSVKKINESLNNIEL